MPKLEVFFDYVCPFCKAGHELLEQEMPRYPGLDIVWCPCEAHPRPDSFGPHSDLCIEGMFFAQGQGVDLWEYHRQMYEVAAAGCVNIEDPRELAHSVPRLLEPQTFLAALQSGRYKKMVQDANQYAYEQNGVWAVPAYRMGKRRLDATEDVGITGEQLRDFLKGVHPL